MRATRRFAPALEGLERRDVPTLVLLADIDTGADLLPSFSGSGYGIPVVPLGNYLEPGLNFAGPTITGDTSDQQGYGGHGSLMAAYYAQTLLGLGIPAYVVPLRVAGANGAITSDSIGRAELWVAYQQRDLRAAGRDVQWIVSLPAEPHPAGLTEFWGRRALAWQDVPIVQAAGNEGLQGDWLRTYYDWDGPSVVMAAAARDGTLQPYSNAASFTVLATVPYYFGTSGATMVGAAYLTAERVWHRTWPNAWTTYQVSHMGVLQGA